LESFVVFEQQIPSRDNFLDGFALLSETQNMTLDSISCC